MEVSTIDCPGITIERRNGNTSRQVDFAISELFKGNDVLVEDHVMGGAHRPSNWILLSKIQSRLRSEHEGVKFLVINEGCNESKKKLVNSIRLINISNIK